MSGVDSEFDYAKWIADVWTAADKERERLRSEYPHWVEITEAMKPGYGLNLTDCSDEAEKWKRFTLRKEIIDWLDESASGNWDVRTVADVVAFEHENDAALFKLWWC